MTTKAEAQKVMDAAQADYDKAASVRTEAKKTLKKAEKDNVQGEELTRLSKAFDDADDALEAAGQKCREAQVMLRNASDDDNARLAEATKNQRTRNLEDGTSDDERQQIAAASSEAQRAHDEAKEAAEKADKAYREALEAKQKADAKLKAAALKSQDVADRAKNTDELVISPDEEVTVCEVPHTFILTKDDNRRIRIRAGLRKIPTTLVDHWWVKANGVKPAED